MFTVTYGPNQVSLPVEEYPTVGSLMTMSVEARLGASLSSLQATIDTVEVDHSTCISDNDVVAFHSLGHGKN